VDNFSYGYLENYASLLNLKDNINLDLKILLLRENVLE
jgi:hypothetical protein